MNKKQVVVLFFMTALISSLIWHVPTFYCFDGVKGKGFSTEKNPPGFTHVEKQWEEIRAPIAIILFIGSILFVTFSDKLKLLQAPKEWMILSVFLAPVIFLLEMRRGGFLELWSISLTSWIQLLIYAYIGCTLVRISFWLIKTRKSKIH